METICLIISNSFFAVVIYRLAVALNAERLLVSELKSQVLAKIAHATALDQVRWLAQSGLACTADGAIVRKNTNYWGCKASGSRTLPQRISDSVGAASNDLFGRRP